jgi:hypothetical protein
VVGSSGVSDQKTDFRRCPYLLLPFASLVATMDQAISSEMAVNMSLASLMGPRRFSVQQSPCVLAVSGTVLERDGQWHR